MNLLHRNIPGTQWRIKPHWRKPSLPNSLHRNGSECGTAWEHCAEAHPRLARQSRQYDRCSARANRVTFLSDRKLQFLRAFPGISGLLLNMNDLAWNTEKQESLPAFLYSSCSEQRPTGLGNFLPNTKQPDQSKSQQSNAVRFGYCRGRCHKLSRVGAVEGCSRIRACGGSLACHASEYLLDLKRGRAGNWRRKIPDPIRRSRAIPGDSSDGEYHTCARWCERQDEWRTHKDRARPTNWQTCAIRIGRSGSDKTQIKRQPWDR